MPPVSAFTLKLLTGAAFESHQIVASPYRTHAQTSQRVQVAQRIREVPNEASLDQLAACAADVYESVTAPRAQPRRSAKGAGGKRNACVKYTHMPTTAELPSQLTPAKLQALTLPAPG